MIGKDFGVDVLETTSHCVPGKRLIQKSISIIFITYCVLQLDTAETATSQLDHEHEMEVVTSTNDTIAEEDEDEDGESKKSKNSTDRLQSTDKLTSDTTESSKNLQQHTESFKKPDSSTKYTWRIDLGKTEPFWKGWFQGLSEKFLSCDCPKMLLLAGVDRLDKELTIGQMQENGNGEKCTTTCTKEARIIVFKCPEDSFTREFSTSAAVMSMSS
ncbi:PPME1 [Mytilus coruscus]|uniref:PPME1 n=1 Tax=Mytilus coruscus TaxID=42192 RepID=A0A6J8AJ61_MYTCO|nr:PPME1 [Mytilus coruscus]